MLTPRFGHFVVFKFGYYTRFIFRKFDRWEYYTNPNKLLFESPQPNLLPLEKG